MFTNSLSNSYRHKIIHLKNGLKLWSESFGSAQNPPILLIIGAGSQCKLWPDSFCEKLAAQGFFVIRYDHRDTGKSSSVEYADAPYTVMDLTQDAVEVLIAYQLNAAHIVGFSMGGQIAQFLGAYFPYYAKTLTLMATSTSFQEGFQAFAGDKDIQGLTPPKEYYVKWATRNIDSNKQSYEEKVNDFIHSWKLLNGNKVIFDEQLYQEIAKDVFTRSPLHNPYPNHALAMQANYKEHSLAQSLIKANTLIIHGSEDPVFGEDHAQALHAAIKDSKLVILNGMGHNLNTHFFDEIINLITQQTKPSLIKCKL
jgi:pimeloyl-ACP methyl ester carboxylesterase